MRSEKIVMSEIQRMILDKISRQSTSSVREVERSKILLCISDGNLSNTKVSAELGLAWSKVQRWRFRWLSGVEKLNLLAEKLETDGKIKEIPYEMEQKLRELLSDAPRPGTPMKFDAATYCQILAVALESPSLSNRPISEWSLTELTDEVHKRGIVTSISRSQVGSFLKSERFKAPQDTGMDESEM
jgi:putative transposase